MRNWPRWIVLVVGLGLGVVYLSAELYVLDGELGFPLDDSWIHLQFARNLASGHGLSFNPGELVTGSTAPLWTALLSILFALPGSPVLWTKLLGGALYLLGGDLTYRVSKELGLATGLATLAAVLTMATDWLVWSALSGLEIPLFVVLSLWGILLHLRERSTAGAAPVSLAVLGVACLARPEGQLLLLLAALDRWLVFARDEEGGLICRARGWRRVLAGLGLAAILLLPVALFNLAVGDSFVPTTFGAKVGSTQGGGMGAVMPELRYLFQAPIGIFFRSQPYMLLLAAAGSLALARRLGTERDRGLLPATWLVGLPLAYGAISAATGGNIAGNFGRYFFPLFPILVIVGCVGLSGIAESLGRGVRVGGHRLPVRALAVALLLWPTVAGGIRGSRRYVQSVGNVHDSDVRVARWLGGRLAPEAVLAVNDIGAFGYFLPNRILDLAGIAHPDARRYRFEASASGRPASDGTLRFLAEHRPDYLVVFPEWFPGLLTPRPPADGTVAAAEVPSFQPIRSFPISDNITMGGNEIVIAATPWTRYPLPLDDDVALPAGAAVPDTGSASPGEP